MTDLLCPPWLNIARTSIRLPPHAGISRSPYNGLTRVSAFAGQRVMASLEYTVTGGASLRADQRVQQALIASLEGPANPVYLTDPARRIGGTWSSIVGGEAFSNGTFDNGTAGWTAHNASSALTVADRKLRATYNNAGVGVAIRNSSAITTLTQYQPYALRFMGESGRGTDGGPALLRLGVTAGSTEFLSATPTGTGMFTSVAVPYSVASVFATFGLNPSAPTAGDYWTCPYASLQPCILVDGRPNSLLRSREFDNASWTKTGVTVSANTDPSYDNTNVADQIVETATTNGHTVEQAITVTSAVQDIAFTFMAKQGSRTIILLEMTEATGGTSVNHSFSIATGAGAFGVTTSTGANWASLRRFIVDYGNGYYACTIVARKTNAATSITGRMYVRSVDNSASYLGNGSYVIAAFAGLAPSTHPINISVTTTAAVAATSPTGSAMYVKGLPASQNGLLLPGDVFEVITDRGSEYHFLTAALNSDASGIGYLQFKPQIRGTISDNAAVIVHQPFGRFMCVSDAPGWDNEPGVFTRASLDFEEA